MGPILEQLGLDNSFFTQFVIIAVLYFLLTQIYFKPFMKLFDARHKRTVEDREAAEKLMAQAEAKLDEYQRRLSEERAAARGEYEAIIADAKRDEAALFAKAREEAKRLTQESAESISKQRDQLKRDLDFDVESLAKTISEKLLSRKA